LSYLNFISKFEKSAASLFSVFKLAPDKLDTP